MNQSKEEAVESSPSVGQIKALVFQLLDQIFGAEADICSRYETGYLEVKFL